VPNARALAFLLALLCSSIASHAVEEIAVGWQSGLVRVPVFVAGQPEPLRFIVDSGASESVIDLRAARHLGLRLGEKRRVLGVGGATTGYAVRGCAGRIGSQTLPEQLLGLDLAPLDASCGGRVDGLIGADFLRDRIVQLDFRARRLRFYQPSESTRLRGEILPVALRAGAICLRVAVNAGPACWMRVDTGCNSALEWAGRQAFSTDRAAASIALSATRRPTIETTVRFGSRQIDRVPTTCHPRPLFAGESGLIGTPLLSRFTVTFDLPRRRIILE